jgi:ankyrin repeat protein
MSNLFEANDPETIRLLLETGVDANTRDRYGKTALFYHLGNSQVLELLIKAGADVNSRDKSPGKNCIHV